MRLNHRSSRKWPIVLGSLLVVALLAVAVAVGTSLFDDGGTHPTAHVAAPVAAQITREQAMNRVASLTAEVPTTATLTAKLLTWSTIRAGQQSTQSVASLTDDQQLWGVLVQGGVTPEFSGTRKADWGLFLVDSVTGQVDGTWAGMGSPPPFFDSATDLAPASSPPSS